MIQRSHRSRNGLPIRTAETQGLYGCGSDVRAEQSEFDDPGFRSVWVIPLGLGIFLAAVALILSMT